MSFFLLFPFKRNKVREKCTDKRNNFFSILMASKISTCIHTLSFSTTPSSTEFRTLRIYRWYAIGEAPEYEEISKIFRGNTDRNNPPWWLGRPGKIVATFMNYLRIGGSGKNTELTNYHQPELRKGQKEERRCQSIRPTHLPESSSLESTFAE